MCRSLYGVNVYDVNVYDLILSLIKKPNNLHFILTYSWFYLSVDKISTEIFQGECTFQFVRGSPSQGVLMPLCKLCILSYFSHNLAQTL